MAHIGQDRMLSGFWWGNLKEGKCLEDLDAVGGIILMSVLTELGWEVVECINVAQIRDRWKAVENTGMNVWVAQNGNFLTSCGTTNF